MPVLRGRRVLEIYDDFTESRMSINRKFRTIIDVIYLFFLIDTMKLML